MISIGIYSTAMAFKNLLDYEYRFVIVRNRNTVPIKLKLNFSKNDFHHLCGLHKLADVEPLRREKREAVFDKIIRGVYDDSMFSKSEMYDSIIDRINCLELLENILDDKNTIFKFNSHVNSHSKIEADFIIKNESDYLRYYFFISQNKTENYFGRSCFSRNYDEDDYTKNHTSYLILYKEKVNLITQKSEELYIAPSYKKELVKK